MIGIDDNLNKDKILEINDKILELARVNKFDCIEARTQAQKTYWDLVNERKRLYNEGTTKEGMSHLEKEKTTGAQGAHYNTCRHSPEDQVQQGAPEDGSSKTL